MPDTSEPAAAEPLRGERAVVLDYLRHFRATFEILCAGLDDEQLARRSVPPSTLSLLGLLRHLAKVEHTWARVVEGHSELEVRDVLVHLVEEYARHCGHADLLRESIDGRTGF